MIAFPNAKINLGLNIISKRPDGYHNINTVFYPINLCDVLEIVPAKGNTTSIHSYGRNINCPPEKNLVIKAYNALSTLHNLPPVDIHLLKNIPDGAGLGGGSSDAAATLMLLNTMFHLNIDQPKLAAIAAKLGADCPFFIYNTPMVASGIGDLLTPANISLAGLHLVLVKPPVYVSTAQAYARVNPVEPTILPHQVLQRPIHQWQGSLVNDFELSVFESHPTLEAIKAQLIHLGADYAAMSGSGSTIFGIFKSANMAETAHQMLDFSDKYVINL